MRLAITCAVATLIGCGDNVVDETPSASCQIEQRLLAASQLALDVLFVVDTSSSMASYADELRDLATDLVDVLDFVNGGRPSLQIGFVSADGGQPVTLLQGDGCTSDSVPFLYDLRDPWWQCGDAESSRCGISNSDGDLKDAMTCLSDLDFAGSTAPTPLDAVRQIATGQISNSAGLFRDGAFLFVIVVSSQDDGSFDNVTRYVDDLAALKGDEQRTLRAAIAPQPSPRLQTFVEPWGAFVDLNDNWLDALVPLGDSLAAVLGQSCLREQVELTDIDERNPGLQLACSAEQSDESSVDAVVPCTMLTASRPHPETALPCYWFEAQEDPTCGVRPRIELARGTAAASYALTCESTTCNDL